MNEVMSMIERQEDKLTPSKYLVSVTSTIPVHKFKEFVNEHLSNVNVAVEHVHDLKTLQRDMEWTDELEGLLLILLLMREANKNKKNG